MRKEGKGTWEMGKGYLSQRDKGLPVAREETKAHRQMADCMEPIPPVWSGRLCILGWGWSGQLDNIVRQHWGALLDLLSLLNG